MSEFWAEQRIKNGAWYGTIGSMIPFPDIHTELAQSGGRPTYWSQRADGAVEGMVLPARPRTWEASGEGMRPDEAAMIRYAVDGVMGTKPQWWLPVNAVFQNVLTPAMSECIGWTGGVMHSGVHTDDNGRKGWAPRSVSAASSATIVVPAVPVLPNSPVALSVFTRGLGKISARWLNAAGAVISTTQAATAPSGVSTTPARIGGTLHSPAAAHSVQIVLTGGTLYANPAVSWGNAVQPYAPGEGCDKAWAYGFTSDIVRIGKYASVDVTFSVQEVG